MTKYYSSEFYNEPIEVDNIQWEILVTITDNSNRKIIYSWYDIISKNSNSRYINECLLWWFIKKIPEKVLIIWFWWWAFCKYLEDHIKNVKITWIDIDKAMFQIAKKELKIKTNDFLIMEWVEAINQLNNENKKFDLILIDVYWNEWKIPSSFLKKNIYINIKKLLLNDWTLSINYADYIWEYDLVHKYLKEIFWKNSIHITSWENYKWNISWIYNLDKKYDSKEIILKYLEKVKKWEILYDSNMIKKIILDKY